MYIHITYFFLLLGQGWVFFFFIILIAFKILLSAVRLVILPYLTFLRDLLLYGCSNKEVRPVILPYLTFLLDLLLLYGRSNKENYTPAW